MMTAETSSSLATAPPASPIETCWPIIEAYADLEASVSVSETCRALHRAIVDADTNKLKVSHFEVDNTPFPSSRNDDDQAIVVKNWHTAPARIPHYLSRSLNAIHFPSLKRLYLDFPPTKRRIASGHADVIDDACHSSFPMFAAYLSYARNLECLHFNTNRLLATERSGQLEASFELFAEHLCRCHKLRELSVVNSGVVRGNPHPVYSIVLMRAVTRAIKQRKSCLKILRLEIAGIPSDPLYSRRLSSKGIDVPFDFFVAVLCAENLCVLEIESLHLNSFAEAANNLLSDEAKAKPSCMKNLKLKFEDWLGNVTDLGIGVAPLLESFSECHLLEHIWLDLPENCWKEDSPQAMRKLLGNKPHLLNITISFSSFSSGEMMKALSECLAPNIASGVLQKLRIFGLLGVDARDVAQLHQLIARSGMVCTTFRALRKPHGHLDVAIMVNRKLVDGEAVIDDFIANEWKDYT